MTSEVSVPDADAAAGVTRLREQRTALEQLTRELMEWINLLRHKALTLRALAGRSVPGRTTGGLPAGLTPGSLDPKALAEELAAGLSQMRPRSSARDTRQLAGLGADQALERARALWDTVADPADALACERLADAAESLAAQLEARVNEALDQYRNLGDDLIRALRRVQRSRAAVGLVSTSSTDEAVGLVSTSSTDEAVGLVSTGSTGGGSTGSTDEAADLVSTSSTDDHPRSGGREETQATES